MRDRPIETPRLLPVHTRTRPATIHPPRADPDTDPTAIHAHEQATPPQRPTELTPVPRDAARTAFGFRPTPYALPDGDKGAIPAALAERRRVDAVRAAEAAAAAAAAANAAASGGDADGAAAAGAGDDGKGEKRKRDKKEKKERKEKKRRRRDGGPEASGLSGPTEISGETTRMS